jgi:hypothetical protein
MNEYLKIVRYCWICFQPSASSVQSSIFTSTTTSKYHSKLIHNPTTTSSTNANIQTTINLFSLTQSLTLLALLLAAGTTATPVAQTVVIPTSTPQLPTSCNPPTSPSTSTYGICAFPLTQTAALDPESVVSFLQGKGCKTI